MTNRVALLFLLIMPTGCVATTSDVLVGNDDAVKHGRGVVVAPGVVLTVSHVAGLGDAVTVSHAGRSTSGVVVEIIDGYPESLSVIHVSQSWILPAPTTMRLAERGDSGGGLYDSNGNCMGLIYGRRSLSNKWALTGIELPPDLQFKKR